MHLLCAAFGQHDRAGSVSEASLDEAAVFDSVDPTRMRDRLAAFGSQARAAWQMGTAQAAAPELSSASRVVIAGMGGSAAGGDLIAGLSLDDSRAKPVTVWRDCGLPAWAGPDTLVIVSSHSGNTLETLSAYDAAVDQRCQVVALTSGGRLQQRARQAGTPVMQIDYAGEPRLGLGYSLFGPLGLLCSLGLIGQRSLDIVEALELAESLGAGYAPGIAEVENRAKQMARGLAGRMVVIYGAGAMAAAARRWKTQLNENAKAWAFAEALPEAGHNAVVGYETPASIRKSAVTLILRRNDLDPADLRRHEATVRVLAEWQVDHAVLEALGKNRLAQVLSATCLGDWVSYYAAILCGIDPSPTRAIDLFKASAAGDD